MNIIDNIDKKLSNKIHLLDSKILTLILYPFARIFNPQFIVIPIAFITYLCFQKQESILPLKTSHLILITPAICYVISLVFNLALCLFLKKTWNRPRPTPPQKGILKNKSDDLRGKERNCSMPSGDSAQGAVFAVSMYFLLNNVKVLDLNLDQNILIYSLVGFSFMICLSRVYFMCHFITDTIVGVFICGSSTYIIQSTLYPILVKMWISMIFQ